MEHVGCCFELINVEVFESKTKGYKVIKTYAQCTGCPKHEVEERLVKKTKSVEGYIRYMWYRDT